MTASPQSAPPKGASRSPITTHVLDTALGRPAAGVPVRLEFQAQEDVFQEIARGVTDADGRVSDLLPPETAVARGIYRITFDTGVYYYATGELGFYPSVTVLFRIEHEDQHYHIPLLLSPYGYTTYRGS